MGTALVTGASAGIGRAFCRELAERGHDLVVVARDRVRLENLSDELEARYGVDVEILVADLGDRGQVQRVADRLSNVQRPVDLLVNNAGFAMDRPILDGAVSEEERALDVMCRAVLVLSHAAGRLMRTRGRGAIVNVSSVAGFFAESSYSAAKAWTTTFSEALSGQLSGTGVTVTALCPGLTHTEFHARAGFDEAAMGSVPELLWLDADRLVRDCLDDVAAGKVISVPGAPYKAALALTRVLPRSLVRRSAASFGRNRRR
jgi:short-subunit dehydrogenase